VDDERIVRRKWRLLKATLNERARRLWAGAEAEAIGGGGVARIAPATRLATIPYGIDDVASNDGFVGVGVHHDRPVFAVKSIEAWWKRVGRERYPNARELLARTQHRTCRLPR
jgi:hypothetical protein